MGGRNLPRWDGQENVLQLIPGRLIGLQGRLARPFWGVMGIWAVLCGALASNRLRWDGQDLLALALVLLLAELAWGSLWDLAAGTDWFRPLADGWPATRPASLPALPYTQPSSPGGRLTAGLARFVGWWREAFWPAAGAALLGLLASAVLIAVLAQLLPDRLRLLNGVLVALAGLGIAWRRRGKDLLAGEAWLEAGLCWLAGHLAFAEMGTASLLLALSFATSVWGALRMARSLPRGLWLLNGGQVVCATLLAVLKQPLAAVAVGLLLLGQVALQPSLHWAGDRPRIFRRTWPWLMAAMLVSALSIP